MVWPIEFKERKEVTTLKSLPLQHVADKQNSFLKYQCNASINSDKPFVRLSIVIGTIGTNSRDVDTLVKMMEAGMNIARLAMGSNTLEYHEKTVENIRTAIDIFSKKVGKKVPICIASDTVGPEIHLGIFSSGKVYVETGALIRITGDNLFMDRGDDKLIYVDYENITKAAYVGCSVLINFGQIMMSCVEVDTTYIKCLIVSGGWLTSSAFVNIPGMEVDLPVLAPGDLEHIKFAVKHKLDFILPSFIRDSADVKTIRKILGEEGKDIKIYSKIENLTGVYNIDEIIEASDGVVIARGDLRTDLRTGQLFGIQAKICARCNMFGKPVIILTQLLESLKTQPKPQCCEITDIANAILGGADAVMSSTETASGFYPVKCIEIFDKVCREAEPFLWRKNNFKFKTKRFSQNPCNPIHAIAIAAVRVSYLTDAASIIVLTTSGKTAHILASYRPICPIVAVTRSEVVCKQLFFYRAVIPVHYEFERNDDWNEDVEARVQYGVKFGKGHGFVRTGDPLIIVTDSKPGYPITNFMRIIYASDLIETITI